MKLLEAEMKIPSKNQSIFFSTSLICNTSIMKLLSITSFYASYDLISFQDRVGWAVWSKRGLFASYLECSGNVVQSQYDGLQ